MSTKFESEDDKDAIESVRAKIMDANTPGFQVEFDPEEAELMGAFAEDALTEHEALEGTADSLDISLIASLVRA